MDQTDTPAPAPAPAPFSLADRVGFISLGVMGRGMVRCLLRAGYALTATTRRAEVVATFGAKSVGFVEDPAGVGRSCRLVVLCVSDAPAVEAVLFGPA